MAPKPSSKPLEPMPGQATLSRFLSLPAHPRQSQLRFVPTPPTPFRRADEPSPAPLVEREYERDEDEAVSPSDNNSPKRPKVSPTAVDQLPLLQAAEALARAHHARYDPSHDFYHVKRVRNLSLSLALSLSSSQEEESVGTELDVLVVELAALFHDLLDRKYLPHTPPGGSSPTASTHLAPFFQPYLESSPPAVSPSQVALVAQIIEHVSYSKEVKRIKEGLVTDWERTCRELHCVQDADKLDAIGAIGVLRCAAYSAVVSRPLYIPPLSSDLRTPIASNASALDHFTEKLFKLEGLMKTPRGRLLAKERTETMRAFVHAVEREEREGLGGLEEE